MAACPSCVKSVCQCHKEDKVDKPDLIASNCIFGKGIYSNVTIEIGNDCQIISMKPASKEIINLCDPCELKPEDDGSSVGGQYEAGFQDAKTTYYDIGYAKGYEEGRDEGMALGESQGYGKGYAEGVDSGYETGLAQGKLETDCETKYNEGYNKGYEEAKAEKMQSAGDLLGSLSTKQAQAVEYKNASGVTKTATIQQVDGVWVSDQPDIVVDPKTGAISINGSNIEANSMITIKPTEVKENGIKIDREPCPEPPEPPAPEVQMKASIVRPTTAISSGGEFMATVRLENAPDKAEVNWRLDYALRRSANAYQMIKGVLSGKTKAEGGVAVLTGRYPAVTTEGYDAGYMTLYAEYTDSDGKVHSTPYDLGVVSDYTKDFSDF